jgi:hypothetical protein
MANCGGQHAVRPVPRRAILNIPIGLMPDIGQLNPADDFPRPIIKMENPTGTLPRNLQELPQQEREHLVGRYRFMGVRLRQDLNQFQTVPISRKTLEL